MLFNSFDFAIFLPIVFVLYWFVINRNLKFQNILLLVSSYYFYGSWNWHFLFLLIFSTGLDYFTGLKMADSPNQKIKKFWFWLSVCINLGFLGVFKYYNFFITSFAEALTQVGFQPHYTTLQIILPVGISFYTFHGLSYVIDIYNDRIKPERSFINYSVFVSFFPLLVAGPIERATHLLPQIIKKREFEYDKAVDGLRQILWGLFKKIVIADNCAGFVNQVFTDYQNQSASTLLLGAVFFAFQIYGDFSGYSDIALGTARLFGIELLRNFAFPYFSRDIAEFWRRWHISLSSWFRDYLYIPLGGSMGGVGMKIRNTFIIFLVSGFWHGANWTYIIWGAYNAFLFLPLMLTKKNRKNTDTIAEGKLFPGLRELSEVLITFILVVFGWIFFRSESVSDAFSYIKGIFNLNIFSMPQLSGYYGLLLSIIVLILVEWFQRFKQHGLEVSQMKSKTLRWVTYFCVILLLFFFGGKSETFIYFQF